MYSRFPWASFHQTPNPEEAATSTLFWFSAAFLQTFSHYSSIFPFCLFCPRPAEAGKCRSAKVQRQRAKEKYSEKPGFQVFQPSGVFSTFCFLSVGSKIFEYLFAFNLIFKKYYFKIPCYWTMPGCISLPKEEEDSLMVSSSVWNQIYALSV